MLNPKPYIGILLIVCLCAFTSLKAQTITVGDTNSLYMHYTYVNNQWTASPYPNVADSLDLDLDNNYDLKFHVLWRQDITGSWSNCGFASLDSAISFSVRPLVYCLPPSSVPRTIFAPKQFGSIISDSSFVNTSSYLDLYYTQGPGRFGTPLPCSIGYPAADTAFIAFRKLTQTDTLHGWIMVEKPFLTIISYAIEKAVVTDIEESNDLSRKLEVFPNPAIDQIQLELPEAMSNYEIEIFSLDGKMKMKVQAFIGSNTIDISSLPKGIYLLRSSNSNDSRMTKIIKD